MRTSEEGRRGIKPPSLLAGIELSEACAGDVGLFAGWIEADHLVVELLGMRQIMLPLLKLRGVKQLLSLVAGTAKEEGGTECTEEQESGFQSGFHRVPFPRILIGGRSLTRMA